MKKISINQQELEYAVSANEQEVIIKLNGVNYRFAQNELKDIPLFKYGRDNHIWNQGEYFIAQELSTSNSGESNVGSLNSPMPGKVFKLLKKSGDQVQSGETIMILEAMKMEHPIKSPIDGVISEIHFKEGEIVSGGVALAVVEVSE